MEYNKLKKIKIGDLVLFTEEFGGSSNMCAGFIRNISNKGFTLNFNKLKEYTFLSKVFMEREIHFEWITNYKIINDVKEVDSE